MEAELCKRLTSWQIRIRDELDRVVEFWLAHSLDHDYGGFFSCLDRDGSVYDDNKYIWLQGRQVWTFMRLRKEVKRYQDDNRLLEAALKGADFLLKHCLVNRGASVRCPFSTTRRGEPTKFQRTIFTECFFTMAMSEMWRGTKINKYQEAAISMMKQIKIWCMEDNSGLGREKLPGLTSTSSLAVPMMALCMCAQMKECDIKWCENNVLGEWAVEEIHLHVQRSGSTVLENVSGDGKELFGSFGRLQNPGHAIECGWFLLQHFKKLGNDVMADKAIESFIDGPFRQGWDAKHGGLFYFMDADGLPPTQLEWNMKLWWPHNEAMIAFLMAYQHTKSTEHLEKFFNVAEYSFNKFSDDKYGEWFGYLSESGEVSIRAKGGLWKGCFHLPRCLYLCEKIIGEILA